MPTATMSATKNTAHPSAYFRAPQKMISRTNENQTTLSSYRSDFMRDRDRLMYATAFRRLAGKTQIYTVSKVDDHRKNRLTHTLEVAQIARTITRALHLDEDLAEAIALGHDLGHTPFGHAGEEMLHKIMVPGSIYVKNSPFYEISKEKIEEKFLDKNYPTDCLDFAYGFKHNIQSVRVASKLEDSYHDETEKTIGLNLTNFTLYGMMRHSKMFYSKKELKSKPNFQNEFKEILTLKGSTTEAWSFEAYIVEWADDIAQWHHDLEDALLDGVMPLSVICDTIKDALGNIFTKHSMSDKMSDLDSIKKTNIVSRHSVTRLSSIVVDTLVTDLVKNSKQNFENLFNKLHEKHKLSVQHETDLEELFKNYRDYTDVLPEVLNITESQTDFNKIIGLSNADVKNIFKSTIGEWVHHSRNVERMNVKGEYIIRKLFAAYAGNPQQLPDGPILHLLVETNTHYYNDPTLTAKDRENKENYTTIDKARAAGIGAARAELDKRLARKDDILFFCKLMRRICDHIASMTDHYAIEEYEKLYC